MTVSRAATLRTFFFAIHAGAKELSNIVKLAACDPNPVRHPLFVSSKAE